MKYQEVLKPFVINRRLTASDCPEGNRRDYSILGNQTSGEERGVQCVMTVVYMYVCLISYMSDFKRETQAWPSFIGLRIIVTLSILLANSTLRPPFTPNDIGIQERDHLTPSRKLNTPQHGHIASGDEYR